MVEEMFKDIDNEKVELDDEIEENQTIKFRYCEENVVEYYSLQTNRYVKGLIFIALISFIITILSIVFLKPLVIVAVILLAITIIFALTIIVVRKNDKNVCQRLLTGEVSMSLEDDKFILEEKFPKMDTKIIIEYEDIIRLDETDNLYIITTKQNMMHIIIKEALQERVLEFKEKTLNFAQIYNNVKVKPHGYNLGYYNYYSKNDGRLTQIQAKEKISNSMFLVLAVFTTIIAFVIHFNLNLLWMACYLPFSIGELIYINLINKKLVKNERLFVEMILTIVTMVLVIFAGMLGLMILLMER